MANVERIDSIYNLAAIQAEHVGLQKILETDTQSIITLYNNLETFQGKSNVGNIAKTWQTVSTAMTGTATASEALAQIQEQLNAQIAKTASLEKQLEAAMKASTAATREFNGEQQKTTDTFAKGNASFDANIQKQVAYRNSMAELRKELKDLQSAILKQGQATQQQLEDQAAVTSKLEQTKIASTDLQRTIRAQIQEQQAAAGATKEWKAQYDQLYQVFHNLSQEERDSDFGKGLGKDLGDLQNKINAIQMGTGNFAQNVGRYAEAFKPAVSVLEKQLQDILGQLGAIETKSKGATSGVQNLSRASVGFDVNKNKPGGEGVTNRFGNSVGFDPNKNKAGNVETVSILSSEAPVYEDLKTKATALSSAIERMNGDFQTSRSAMLAARESAIEINTAFGMTNDTAVLFTESLGHVENGVNDIKAALAFQAKDAKLLVGLSEAATGIVGGVGAAQAAISLLGKDSDDTQKKLVQLQEIMLLINGLQQVTNALQAESGAVQLALAAKASLNMAAQKINTIITREATAAIYAEAEANIALIDSYNVVITTEAEAAAAVQLIVDANTEATASALGLSLAEDEVAVSAVSAEAAVSGLSTALIATGLGALIVVIAAAVGFLIYKIIEWTANTKLTVKQQKELNDALDEQLSTLRAINNLKDATNKDDIEQLEHALELEEKSGQNQYAILAVRKKLADLNASQADDKLAYVTAQAENKYSDQGLIGTDAVTKAKLDAQEQLTRATYNSNALQKQLSVELGKSDKDRIAEKKITAMKEAKEEADSRIKYYKSEFDFYHDAETNATKTHYEQQNLILEIDKFTKDQQRKLILSLVETEVSLRKDANERILSDERSTLTQRLAAIKSNAEQSRIQTAANLSDVVDNVGSTKEERKAARAKAKAENDQIDRDEADKDRDTKREYYVRDRDAATQVFILQQQDKQAQAKKILNDDESNFNARTTAQSQLYESQRAEAGAQFLKDLDQLGMTDEEKLKLSKDYETKLLQLNIDYAKTREDEQKKDHEKQIKELENFYDKQRDTATIKNAEANIALNKQLLSGKLGPAAYDRRKDELNFRQQVDAGQTNVSEAEGKVNETQAGTKARLDAETDLAKARMDLSDLITEHEEKNIKKRNDLEQQAAEETANALTTIIDAGFEKQIANIEKQIKKNDQLKDETTSRIQASTLGEQQKAVTIDIINRQTAANNEALQKREVDIKIRQAKFDRDVAVAEAIEQGSIAALAALKIPVYGEVEAIAIGVITAAKVAEILARPLPTYGFGTEDHPGGPAWTGDRYQKELILEPGKPAIWSKAYPNIMDLAPHTKVIPLDDIEQMQRSNMFVDDRGILVSSTHQDKSYVIAEAIENQTERLEKTMSRQKKQTIVHNHIDLGWTSYIQTSVYR